VTALGWTIATAVGFALVGLTPCNREQQEVFFFGLLGALPQALFLFLRARPRIGVAWLVVTAIAVPIAYFIAMITTLLVPGRTPLPLIAGCVVAGLIVGAAQSTIALGLALRPRAALRWVVASALGGPAAGAFLLTIIGLLVIGPDGRVSVTSITAVSVSEWGCGSSIPRPVLGLLLGALYGAITGAVLERCLRDTASP
jgi:hypothetical protein